MHSTDVTARVRQFQQRLGRLGRPDAHSAEADDDAVAVDGWYCLLPEGIWLEARYIGHETAIVFNTAKVFLYFQVVEPGEHFEKRLFRAFRARKLTSRPGKGGKFAVRASGDLYATLERLLDTKQRVDRITFQPLRSMLFRIKTRTVKVDRHQKKSPEHRWYSVVDAIERQQ